MTTKYNKEQKRKIIHLAYECIENQRALAKELGCTQQHISACMTGKAAPGDFLVQRAIDYFGDDEALAREVNANT
jgi:DNA-binding XRE family transcriptional regulator